MITLDKRYVFHIPSFKFVNCTLVPISIEDSINQIIDELAKNGYDSLYITHAKGYYRTRCFDEILITLFTSDENKKLPEVIFKEWFLKNNNILKQEAFAYEINNEMFIEEI